MKKSLAFLTSVVVILLFSFTTPAKHAHVKQAVRKATYYPTYYQFGYNVFGTAPNQYDITIYFYLATQVPSGTTYTLVNCPTSVQITVDNGPLTGASFTFPAGVSSYEIDKVNVDLPNQLIHYDIETNPSGIGGLAVVSTIWPTDSL